MANNNSSLIKTVSVKWLYRMFTAALLWLAGINSLFAQTAADSAKASFNESYYDILAVAFLVVVILIFFGFLIFGMGEDKAVEKEAAVSFWSKIRGFLDKSVPVEKEKDILLDHDYDGIKELDNRIPPWFSYLFYITILFGIYYMLDYHVFKTGELPYQEYADEMAAANKQQEELVKTGAALTEDNVTLLTDAADIQAGKEIFKKNCVACHGPKGGGLVGPNLTDDYWIHGGGIKNIFRTIKYGVPAKGMISWQSQLSAKQIQEVASFVISIHGTNPQNAKAPQGEKYVE